MIIELSQDKLKELARFEKRFSDIVPKQEWGKYYDGEIGLHAESKYAITIEDKIAALKNLGKIDKEAGELYDMLYEEWVLYDEAFVNKFYSTVIEDIKLPQGLWNATETADREIFSICDKIFDDNWPEESISNIEQAMKYIAKPFDQREYSRDCKEFFVNSHFEQDLEQLSQEVAPFWKSIVEELCEENDKGALRAKAYSCYGGNAAYECDWVASRDCLLKLMELTDDPFIANTLGYIYYYGRCTDGVPEYELAFKYFSIGAAGGVYESRYKLSDMFRHGYSVNKNMRIARAIIFELYDDNLRYMMDEEFQSKFADVALRMGKLAIDDEEYESAFYYLLQAEYAIMKRAEYNHYGDGKVAKGIAVELEKARELSGHPKALKSVIIDSFIISHYLNPYLEQGYLVNMKYKRLKDGKYSLKFTLLPILKDGYAPRIWITNTAASASYHTKSLTVNTVGTVYGWKESGSLVFNYLTSSGELYLNWDKVGELPGLMKMKTKTE